MSYALPTAEPSVRQPAKLFVSQPGLSVAIGFGAGLINFTRSLTGAILTSQVTLYEQYLRWYAVLIVLKIAISISSTEKG